MPLTAITRSVSHTFADCQLEYIERQPIDVAQAIDQHTNYERAIEALGVRVVSLPADPSLPDGLFVEDPALVLDEIAIMGRMAKPERQGESTTLAAALSDFRPLVWLREPATLEGGDVMRADKALYVGLSRRTNQAGVEQLAAAAEPHGYTVVPVPVDGCMHLKTAVSYLGNRTVLANRNWFDTAALSTFDIIDVPPEEPWAANVLRISDTILIPKAHPKIRGLLENAGFNVQAIDTSELAKAEAGMTCMSLVFTEQAR